MTKNTKQLIILQICIFAIPFSLLWWLAGDNWVALAYAAGFVVSDHFTVWFQHEEDKDKYAKLLQIQKMLEENLGELLEISGLLQGNESRNEFYARVRGKIKAVAIDDYHRQQGHV